ncbi:MAG: hypothetical protein D3925_08290 [Candidatus Electrothrix sp. AR5]|nr:hypothetical protein [Candidatus Electrothrix sp. AR5]
MLFQSVGEFRQGVGKDRAEDLEFCGGAEVPPLGKNASEQGDAKEDLFSMLPYLFHRLFGFPA